MGGGGPWQAASATTATFARRTSGTEIRARKGETAYVISLYQGDLRTEGTKSIRYRYVGSSVIRIDDKAWCL